MFRIFRIKGIKINNQSQNLTIAVDELMRSLFKMLFWSSLFISPFGCLKIYELIKPYFELIKPLLEKIQ